MKLSSWFLMVCVFWAAHLLLVPTPGQAHPADMVTYVGGPRSQRFYSALELSDQSVVVVGSSVNLDWVPPTVPRAEIDSRKINSAAGTQIPFLLHLSADLKTMIRLVQMPAGTVPYLRFIKASSAPGQPTGDLFISGPRVNGDLGSQGGPSGYFIAKLNANFLGQPPTGFAWVYNIAALGAHQQDQPWDVDSLGRVYFAAGEPYSRARDGWASIFRLNDKGQLDVVEHWRQHQTNTGPWQGAPASSRPGVRYSTMALTLLHRGSLRSWTMEQFTAETPDGNGGSRRGTWPMDYFFSVPFKADQPERSNVGPGYTGMGLGPSLSAQCGAIVVDRRTNHFYFGFTIQSRLPNERLSTEPAVVAMDQNGQLKWWSRLYSQTPENSPPDQFVDALAVDYSRPPDQSVLVVGGSSRRNHPNNFWRGDQIKKPGHPGRSFQSGWEGTADNFLISWLGRLNLQTGALHHATYVGEYAESARFNTDTYQDPLLAGWQDHDKSTADLSETRIYSCLHVDDKGRIYVLGKGRRVITTTNAYQSMTKPSEGLSTWTHFARVYKPDLTGLVYSTILTGKWDSNTGVGGNNATLLGMYPVKGGLLVSGFHNVDRTGVIEGNPIPTINRPSWGLAAPQGETAILGRLGFD